MDSVVAALSKTCTRCKTERPLSEFHKKNGKPLPICGPCRNEENRAYRIRSYGICEAQHDELLKKQGNRCAICRTDKPGGNGSFHIDHCHSSGKVRGLLCANCNMALGKFFDNTAFLQNAINYLQEHQ